MLVLASGCSVGSEPQDDLVPSWDIRGIVTYHHVPKNQAAAKATTAASPSPQDPWLEQQEATEAKERRRREVLAYQDMRTPGQNLRGRLS
jgi:hypothetical protein